MERRRRLLFVADRYAPDLGGVARSATRTAQMLSGLGVDVDVLAWTRTLPAGEIEHSVGPAEQGQGSTVRIHRMGLFAHLDYSLQHTLTYAESLHRAQPFDGVWGHSVAAPGFLAVLFAASVGIPATVSARGNDVDMQMFPPGDFARLSWTLERANGLTAVSQDLARKMRLVGRSERSIRVVHNSVDLGLFHREAPDITLRTELGIHPEDIVLGFSGELRHKKGLRPMLAAFAEVCRSRPACLLVIGEVRPRDQAALSELAVEHPEAHPRILVTGHLEDSREIVRRLNLCDLFLQPSHWDGLPNAVLEAMACERVVLASDAGGIPEAIVSGESGFLIPRTELHRLGEGILELMSLSASQRQDIGRRARQRVIEQFSPAVESTALTSALADLWADPQAPSVRAPESTFL
jgi:glycosyltransferase involved in cell wall biosynthesis